MNVYGRFGGTYCLHLLCQVSTEAHVSDGTSFTVRLSLSNRNRRVGTSCILSVFTLPQHMEMLQVSMKFGTNVMLLGDYPNIVFINFLQPRLTTWLLADPLNFEPVTTLATVIITNQPQGDDPSLRSHQLLSYWRISKYSTKPEDSLPCSEEPRLLAILPSD
jgi:hypothetical protein